MRRAPSWLARGVTLTALAALPPLALPAAAADRPAHIEAELGATLENLDRGREDWRAEQFDVEYHSAGRSVYYAGLRHTRRFGLDDDEGKAGIYLPLGTGVTLNVEGAATREHRVLPRSSLQAQLGASLGDGWGAGLGLRRNSYQQSSVTISSLLVEKYLGAHRFAYTLYSGDPSNAPSATSHNLRWSFYYGEHSHLGLSATRGRETENVAGAGLQTTDVRGLALLGRHWLGERWALAYELSRFRQGDLYTRRGGYVGLRHSF